MESSLHEWLVKSAEEFGEYNTDDEKLVAIGTFLFQNDVDENNETIMSLQEICSRLSRSLGVVLEPTTSYEILTEALLIYAVSPSSHEKGLFVQIIMELEPDVQASLKEAIIGNLHRHDLDDLVEAITEAELITGDDVNQTLVIEDRKSIVASDEPTLSGVSCPDCKVREKELESINTELENALQLEVKLRAEIANTANKLVDYELMINDREEQVSECKNIIVTLKKKIEDLEKEAKRSDINSEELIALRDELDILRPKAEKLESCQSQLEKLREKIDELKDVKIQLKKEQVDHSQTFSRLVAAEHDLELLQKAKVCEF